jgi:hypothetical protein
VIASPYIDVVSYLHCAFTFCFIGSLLASPTRRSLIFTRLVTIDHHLVPTHHSYFLLSFPCLSIICLPAPTEGCPSL